MVSNQRERGMRRSRSRLAVGLSTLVLAGFVAAGPAQALTINPTFDSSFSSLPLTQQQGIKDAFSTAVNICCRESGGARG